MPTNCGTRGCRCRAIRSFRPGSTTRSAWSAGSRPATSASSRRRRTVDAWRNRELDEDCPLGNPLAIGHEIASFGNGDVVTCGSISFDVKDGSVYFLDGDSYVYYITDGLDQQQVDVEELAPDLVTFFARYVFGPEYPDLVNLVCMDSAYRARKRRDVDPWMRLLVAADLVVPPPDRRAPVR